MHKLQVTVRFAPDDVPLYSQLVAYADVRGIDVPAAIKALCVLGLRVPMHAGSAPNLNPLDDLLAGIIPDKHDLAVEDALIEREVEHAQPPPPPPEPTPAPIEENTLPSVGVAETDRILAAHVSHKRKTRREAEDTERAAEAIGDVEDTPPLDERETYGVIPSKAPTKKITVTDPETGTAVEITPQRAVHDSQMESVDSQLHSVVPERTSAPRQAPESELLSVLVSAINLRR